MREIRPVIKAYETPEPLEVMQKSIVAISDGVRKLRGSKLNDKALFLLIQNACPRVHGKTIGVPTIKAVIEGMESLEKIYLKK